MPARGGPHARHSAAHVLARDRDRSPFFGQNATSEYLHNLVVVLALTLFASWLLCLTVTPLLCYHFVKPHHKQEQGDAYDTRFYRGYRRVLEWVLHHKAVYVASMIAALAIALYGFTTLPYDFMPKSDRLQFQIPVQLAPVPTRAKRSPA